MSSYERVLSSGWIICLAISLIGHGALAASAPLLAGRAYTLANLSPAMKNTIGFHDPSYALSVLTSSPVIAQTGDTSDQFMAPDGKLVTVTVQSPVTTKTFNANPITPGQDPLTYFAQKIATAGSGSILYIPTATYNFLPIDCTNTSDPSYHGQYILVQAVHDLVIDGQGSTLNFASDCRGLVIYGATRIIFRNFIIDWPTLQNSAVGTVTAVAGNASSGYTYNLQVPVTNIVAGGFDAATGWDNVNNYWSLQSPGVDFYTSTASPYTFSPTGLATNASSGSVQLTVGQSLLVRHLSNNSAVQVGASSDITVDTISMYNSPGIGYLISGGRGFHMIDCQIDRRNGRPISTIKDAVHFGSFGGDVIIENNNFAYQGDDGLNIHTVMLPVAVLPSCASVTANCPGQLPVSFGAQNGDAIGLFSTWMRLMSMQTASCGGQTCTTNVAPIAATNGAYGGYVADMSLANARYIVQNNSFSYNRSRGFLAQTPYGLVQNNSFVGQTSFPLYLVTSAYWQEGPGAQDVLVLNNQLTSPGLAGGLGAVTLAAEDSNGNVIYDSGAAVNGRPIFPGTEQNIVFAKNTFSNLPGAAFYISSANNVVLYNNTLTNTNLQIRNIQPNVNAPIVIYDASYILLSGSVSNSTHPLFVSDVSDGPISVQ